MMKIITHNIDAVIKQLDTYQRSHLPKAASQALKSFGFDSRELLQKEMDTKFGSVSLTPGDHHISDSDTMSC